MFVPRLALLSLLPSGKTRNPVSPHYLGESSERLKSSDGPAKQERVSGQGPRLEESLVEQAIEQECSWAQWKSSSERKALEEMTSELDEFTGLIVVKFCRLSLLI